MLGCDYDVKSVGKTKTTQEKVLFIFNPRNPINKCMPPSPTKKISVNRKFRG